VVVWTCIHLGSVKWCVKRVWKSDRTCLKTEHRSPVGLPVPLIAKDMFGVMRNEYDRNLDKIRPVCTESFHSPKTKTRNKTRCSTRDRP
jgi:hypothetical protein